MFPKIRPKNGWFIIENLIRIDDLGPFTLSPTLHRSRKLPYMIPKPYIGDMHHIIWGFPMVGFPPTMVFPTKNDHFRGVLAVPPFKETPV